MFDTYVSRNVSERVTENVTVNKYRAPTDESVKLLNEMTQKALNNIVKSFTTTNNVLQMKCCVYEDYRNDERVFLCKFTLNGKSNELTISLESWKYHTPNDMIQELYKRVCDKLALEIMKPLLEEMQSQFNR